MALHILEATPVSPGEQIDLGRDVIHAAADTIIREGGVYCIKNCIHPSALKKLKNELFEYYLHIPQTRISYDDVVSSQNYHSVEKGVSAYQKSLHYFHAYVFNDMESLADDLKSVAALFHTIVQLYNSFTKQQRTLNHAHDDGKKIRSQIFQYPAGGGMFASHIHPFEPQKIGMILALSERGVDYQEGGTGFEAPDGSIIDTSSTQDIGDMLLFRYDMKHWVSPCDIHSRVDESSSKGRWSAVITLY